MLVQGPIDDPCAVGYSRGMSDGSCQALILSLDLLLRGAGEGYDRR